MRKGRTPTQLFLARIEIGAGCWPWSGCVDQEGYGRVGGERAHRVSYEFFVGPIPKGLDIDHLCRNRGCVNPLHMEPVSRHVNTLRGEGPGGVNARKTRCSRGHRLSGANVRFRRTGINGRSRVCRPCDVIRQRIHKQRRLARATGRSS